MDDRAGGQRSRAFLWIVIALAAAAVVTARVVTLVRRRSSKRPGWPVAGAPSLHPETVRALQGLTEEEAAARQLEGQDDAGGTQGAILFKPLRSKREIWRANTLTIFNAGMVGLAAVQVLLGKPWDAVLTTLVLFLGIGLNIGQALWARGRLRILEQAARPQATVIREGTVRSIDPSEVVRGDILVVGPGDHILADGQVVGEVSGGPQYTIIVDESMLTGDPQQHTRQGEDPVYAGSFCVAGHAAYKAQKVGRDRLIAALTGEFEAIEEELTPLEKTIDRLLRVLLVVVAIFSLLLLADYFDQLFPNLDVDAFASAASVIFGIAPSSLFLMILVNYAMGTADLRRVGALVHRSRSVESLAQATVVCFAQAGILTGVGVEMTAADPARTANSSHRPRLADSRIRQILGSYARSTSADSPAVRAMRGAFPGTQRRTSGEAPFLSAYGWSAVAFDEDDLRGVYVLGDPAVIETHLASDDGEGVGAESPPVVRATSIWRDRIARLGQMVRSQEAAQPEQVAQQVVATPSAQHVAATPMQEEESPEPGLFQRLVKRVDVTLQRGKVEPDAGASHQVDAIQGAGRDEIVYMVAYRPDLVPLHTTGGMPCLPEDLIPLCRLHYTEQVRPEAVETIRAFSQKGVGFKIFSPDAPERTAAALSQAGLGDDGDASLRAIAGPDMGALDEEQLAQAVVKSTIFGQVTPEQAGQVVEVLRQQGETVAVVGDGVNDLQAMQQANLSFARQKSSPAALSVADIVLLEDSPQAMLRVLDKGQRITNGLLDILKLYLAQISYLVLLIVAIWGMGIGFPYLSKQGSLITIVSVVLPSVGLSLWAVSGVVPRSRLGWLLAKFVGPAAVTISAAAVVVYRMFLSGTGDEAYAQLVLTYLLVTSGLALVVLLRPPLRPRVGGDERSGDWRPTALVLVLWILVFVVAPLPLADQFFGLKPLRQPEDYVIVGLAVLAWVFTTLFVWRVAPVERLWQRFQA